MHIQLSAAIQGTCQLNNKHIWLFRSLELIFIVRLYNYPLLFIAMCTLTYVFVIYIIVETYKHLKSEKLNDCLFLILKYLRFLHDYTRTGQRRLIIHNKIQYKKVYCYTFLKVFVIQPNANIFLQIVQTNRGSVEHNLQYWSKNIWNVFDMIMYFLFLVSVFLRCLLNSDQFYFARMAYAIT